MSLIELNTALYSKIGGTATSAGTAVFFLRAPDNQPLPYVVWSYAADRDENLTANRTRNSVLFIRAYANTQQAAGTIDKQIDTLLHGKPLTVTGWTNFWLAREDSYAMPEIDESGNTTYMVGADYRVRLDSN